jgi:hypothetical protein
VSGDVPGAVVRMVGYVKVGKSYGGVPPDTLWSTDGLFPDALLEDASVAVAANQNQPIWITIPAKAPGVLHGTLTVRAGDRELSAPLAVHVHNVRMGKPRLWICNWLQTEPEQMAILAGHKVEPFSDEYWKLYRQMTDFMAAYHQNVAFAGPLDLVQLSQKDGRWSFDFARFDKTMETFFAAGINGRIMGAQLGWRSNLGQWWSPFALRVPQMVNGKVNFKMLPPSDAATKAFYRQFLPALAEHLAARGWDKIYWQSLGDEPAKDNAASYRQVAELVHATVPGMRVIEALQTTDLVGAVNIWVPILDQLQRDYPFFSQRQKAGDEVWFYTCCVPMERYANRFTTQPLLKPRLLHWINFRYGVTGYLYACNTNWQPGVSPWDQSTNAAMPAGTDWIVYPKDGKLLSSMRMEAMRDGIGDHELLSMLAQRDPALARKLAAETILNFDRYDTDIARFRARRLQLLEALELGTAPAATAGRK